MIANFVQKNMRLAILAVFALMLTVPVVHAQTKTIACSDIENASEFKKGATTYDNITGDPTTTYTDATGDTVSCTLIPDPNLAGSTNGCDVKYANGNTGSFTCDFTTSGATASISQTKNPQGTVISTDSSYTNPFTNALGTATGVVAKWLAGGIATAEGGIAFIILSLTAVILSIVGTLFNWTVVFTVFDFGKYFGNSAGLLLGWGILRDIGNIILLFAFIYFGIMVILDTHGFEVQKTLPRLIIVAVLLNFSLFAAEAIIDVSNVLSASLFSTAGQTAANCTATANATSCASTGIADQILQESGLNGIFPTVSKLGDLVKDPVHTTIVFIVLIIFISIVSVVLLAATILLAIRAVVLILVMITAPVGFVAAALPQTEAFWKRWLHMLLSQSFFAPVYLLLLYVGLKVMNGLESTLGGLNSRNLYDAVASGGANSQSYGVIFIVFTLMTGFMVAALIAAKNMGAVGASFATNTASRAIYGTVTRASNLAVNGTGFGIRKAIQSRANPLRNSFVSRLAVSALARPLENANVDQRYAVGGMLRAAGATTGANVASHATLADMRHAPQQVREMLDKNKKQYESEIKENQLHEEAHAGHLSNEMVEFLNKKNDDELAHNHMVQVADPTVIQALNPEKFEALLKNKNLSDTVKDNIRNARFAEYNTAIETINNPASSAADITAATDKVKKMVKESSKKDFENMPGTILMHEVVLNNLPDKMRDDLSSSDNRSQSERQAIKASSKVARTKTEFEDAGGGAAGAAAITASGTYGGLSREQIAKLDKEILMQPSIIRTFTPNVLLALQDEKGKFTPADITAIRNEIIAHGTAEAQRYIADPASPGGAFWS